MSRHRSRYMKQILLICLPFFAAVALVDAQESFISPDKVFEAYTTSDTCNVILRLRPTGMTNANNIARLGDTLASVTIASGYTLNVQWSPDSRFIAVITPHSNLAPYIYRIARDGNVHSQCTVSAAI